MGNVSQAAALYSAVATDPVAALSQLQRGAVDSDDLVRHVAGVQLAIHHPRELPEATARELLDTLMRVSQMSDESPLAFDYTRATENGHDCWDLGQHIALALAKLPAGSADFAIPELVSLWRRDRQFYEAVLAAVALSFPEGHRTAESAITGPQRNLLAALIENDAVWTLCGDTAPMLEARGLPSSQRAMTEFLATADGSV